jgi:hypothetical protein
MLLHMTWAWGNATANVIQEHINRPTEGEWLMFVVIIIIIITKNLIELLFI